MILSEYLFKKKCDGKKGHLDDIGRVLDSFFPLSMALYQVITSPSSKYYCNILHQNKKKTDLWVQAL